jgi:hypothetical protein
MVNQGVLLLAEEILLRPPEHRRRSLIHERDPAFGVEPVNAFANRLEDEFVVLVRCARSTMRDRHRQTPR